jgi:P2-related tail formation protein
MDKVMASAMGNNAFSKALHDLVAGRWDNWNLQEFLVYLVDNCAQAALPYLAEQLDVEAMAGFAVATDIAEQRELLKKSIVLHKYLGTAYAIKESCKAVGFPVIEIKEGTAALGNLPAEYDIYPDDTKWALFRVLLLGHEDKHITQEQNRKLRLFVETYKPQRCILVTIGYQTEMSDMADVSDKHALHDTIAVFDSLVDDEHCIRYLHNYKVGDDPALPYLPKYLIDDAGTAITGILNN